MATQRKYCTPEDRVPPQIIACPHCRYPSGIYFSDPVTRINCRLTLWCTNQKCGHQWEVYLTAVRTITPSKKPHPEVRLPVSTGRFG